MLNISDLIEVKLVEPNANDLVYHYTYKISSESGLYYVGRHSTKNLDDDYLGSGKWVKSIKKKSSLKKEILNFFDSLDGLKCAEKKLLEENINNTKCMNFNNEACGWSSGLMNPAHKEEVKKLRSELYKNKKRKKFSEEWKNNMSKSHVGLKQSENTINKRIEKYSKEWLLFSPENDVFIVRNLSKFCRDRNLDQGNMIKVAKGIYKHCKNWKCAKVIGDNKNE